MPDTRLAMLSLQAIPGVGARTLNRALSWAKQTDSSIADIFSLSDDDLRNLLKLRTDSIDALRQTSPYDSQPLLDGLNENGFEVCIRGEDDYPAQLEASLGENAPPLLTLWGALTLLHRAGIASSGSRHTSSEGIERAQNLAAQAAERGITVISGHAPGTDIAAHYAALTHDGTTILVLPEGVMRFRANAELQPFMESGRVAVVSEFPPQMPWSAQNAMIRNQTIIGLAQALIIIEAGDSGGTLDAGRRALKLAVPVYVLSLSSPPPGAAGNALLISEGATPLPVEPDLVLPTLTLHKPPLDDSQSPTQPTDKTPPQQMTLL